MSEIFAEDLPPVSHEDVVKSYSESVRNLKDDELKAHVTRYLLSPHVSDFVAHLMNNPERRTNTALRMLRREFNEEDGNPIAPKRDKAMREWIHEHEMSVVAGMLAEEIFNNQIYPDVVWDSESLLAPESSDCSMEFYFCVEACIERIQDVLMGELSESFGKIFYAARVRSKTQNALKS